MDRRTLLTAGAAGLAAGLAGCSGLVGGDNGGGDAPFEHPGTLGETFATNADYPADGDPADGLPPAFPDPPEAPDVDPSGFETLEVNGETVRLAPIDVVEAWYRRAAARFVDARGLDQYTRAHVYGGVLSTATRESTGGGIDGWPTDGRVVTYCGCPHHLSSLRAAGLQKAGFSEVYAIDEGFGVWSERGYPMAGTAFADATSSDVSEWVVEGTVAARFAGEYAWAAVDRQYEAAPIAADGSFALHLRFAGVTGETPVRISTPAWTVTRPLADLSSGVLRGG